MIRKAGTVLLVLVALVFMFATIFNPSSRYHIDADGWNNVWRWLTGQ